MIGTTIAAATAGPTAYWYLTRGTGAITLILLTLSVALGIANVRGVRTAAVPRFVFGAVHRSVSLLAVAFLFVHVATTLLDGFVPIHVIDAIVPFGAAYRPFWLGLGAVSSDLVIAVVLTSLLRRRLGYGAWRATHWLAYASWPVAVLHAVGTGSDAGATWMLVIIIACATVVTVAVITRLADLRTLRATPERSRLQPRSEHPPRSERPIRTGHVPASASEQQSAPA
jgi:sulfoxide reductase heme-binding subunit YedZ